MSGKAGVSALRTKMIIHHGITDIISQATKLLHILSTVQELCDLPTLFQWNELLMNLIQCPSR